MYPLTTFGAGSRVRIKRINGGWGIRWRLESMGIIPGVEVEVLNPGPGPVVLKVGNSRIAIGYGQAMKILAEEVK